MPWWSVKKKSEINRSSTNCTRKLSIKKFNHRASETLPQPFVAAPKPFNRYIAKLILVSAFAHRCRKWMGKLGIKIKNGTAAEILKKVWRTKKKIN